ncbi:MAG: hypothetical protein ABJA79_09365 [Parafilimonas sp.]
MPATILNLKNKKNAELTPEQKAFLDKLLKAPTMSKKQIKEYEKRFPWLKKYKD